jgi:large subunit ribosomal protein L6
MSRIGKKPIEIPKDVKISIAGGIVEVSGVKGKLQYKIPSGAAVEINDNKVLVTRLSDTKKDRSLHGLVRTLIVNMIEGVAKGYAKSLEIQGMGFRAQTEGSNLVMQLGFTHPVKMAMPQGIKVETPKPTLINVSGIDKALVGQIAADIRDVMPPEPYKGKGIRYVGEVVRKKLGKAATATAAK